jgi:queuine tRNA-ribosyltransferase
VFSIQEKDATCRARNGILHLPHGDVSTPVFMPVGTNGPVKTFMPYELKEMDVEIMLSNAYHLYLRPGMEVIEKAGGLHRFAGWDRNILTDSGGFQLFSLSKLNTVLHDGIEFNSHIDGSRHYLTPAAVVDIQRTIGSDIMMVLDHCTAAGSSHKDSVTALETTTRWARESMDHFSRTCDPAIQKIFGIVQGNMYHDLRKRSAEEICEIGFPGIAIGGLSVGESREIFAEILEETTRHLPEEKPRYLMGVGTPRDIFTGVESGIDMFDCVFPTRVARNASVLTLDGRINLRNEQFRFSDEPLDPNCDCHVCSQFSRSYIRHLFKAKEITACRMTSYHNIWFMQKLLENIRTAIGENRLPHYKTDFLKRYNASTGRI